MTLIDTTDGVLMIGGYGWAFVNLLRKLYYNIVVTSLSAAIAVLVCGPQLAGWGDVVAKYPDGTPAIVEGTAAAGRVILSGIHPEAPENWRHGMAFATAACGFHKTSHT